MIDLMRYHAPYMEWAKTRPTPEYDLAISNILACQVEDLPGARDAIALTGANDNGYAPLVEAIAARYAVEPTCVATANGTSGANFLVYAALLGPGDDVLIERPGYDPLLAAPRLVGASTTRFDRTFEEGWALDPDRVEGALTPRTKLIVLTRPHNPTGVAANWAAIEAIGRIASSAGAHVLVDEVYLDVSGEATRVAAAHGDPFISTSSLTKSYGLSGLRCGWTISSPQVAERIRRARDVVDGTGSIVAERLSVLAFSHLDALAARARGILARNAPIVRAFLDARSELSVVPSVGTVVFPRLLTAPSADRFAERLMGERQTAIVPGRFFDAPGHFRLGLSGNSEALQAGLSRIGDALDARAW
jgi:aspartate/methionine/tyrosine aminotransferase